MFEGNVIVSGQFSSKAIVLRVIDRGAIIRGGQSSMGQLSRGQFCSGSIVLEQFFFYFT